MTKAIITSPFNKISGKLSSHRGAQAFIYAAQLQEHGLDVTVDVTGDANFSAYDHVYVYHGNDWSGSLNMFGGVSKWDGLERLGLFSSISQNQPVFSLAIDYPNYSEQINERLKKADKETYQRWSDTIDLANLEIIEARAPVIDTNFGTGLHTLLGGRTKIVAGDSHAISLYRPGWMVNSVPYSTLYGSLQKGLNTFVKYDPMLVRFTDIDLYFGNIDIRHHLCRQPEPLHAAADLARHYMSKALELAQFYGANVRVFEPLPIEDESRKVPATGFYRGTAFYGSWEHRNSVRSEFIDVLEDNQTNGVNVVRWTGGLLDKDGKLSFDAMEKPRSVHLSRASYPFWHGRAINTTRG